MSLEKTVYVRDCEDKETLAEIVKSLVKVISTLSEKLDSLDQRFCRIEDINKKINEIHILHFPKEHFQTDKTLREKYLAEIILGIPKKRKT